MVAKEITDYLIGADIIRYIKAQEKIADKIAKRGTLTKVNDYISYLEMFIGRYKSSLSLIDGIRRISNQQTKWDRYVAIAELSYTFYKYSRSYIGYKRGVVWTKFIGTLGERWKDLESILARHLPRKNSGDKTGA